MIELLNKIIDKVSLKFFCAWMLVSSLSIFAIDKCQLFNLTIITCIIIILTCFFLIKMVTSIFDEDKRYERECKRKWAKDVKEFFYRQNDNVKQMLFQAYSQMKKYQNNKYERFSSDAYYINLCNQLSKYDFRIDYQPPIVCLPYKKECVQFDNQNGVVIIKFDPILYKELKKYGKI